MGRWSRDHLVAGRYRKPPVARGNRGGCNAVRVARILQDRESQRPWSIGDAALAQGALIHGLCETNNSTVVLSGIMSFEVVPLLKGTSKRVKASSRIFAVSGATPLRTYSRMPIAGASPKIAVVSGPCASQPAVRSTLASWLA